MTLKEEKLREQARGRWPCILDMLDIHVRCDRRHGPCPTCGGKDRFRFDDREGRGTWFCNQCIPHAGDGFTLIQKIRRCDFGTALRLVTEALGDRTEPPRGGAGKKPAKSVTPPAGTLGVNLFAYHDATGRPAIYVKRINHRHGGKHFCQWGPTADKMGWQAKLDYAPKPRPLYRLPTILTNQGTLIVFHEGEKATEAAIKANLPGIHSTTIGGASNPRQSDFSALIGFEVVVCPDNDDDGERFAASVALLAQGAGAKSVRILRLPGLPSKGDVIEWLTGGGTAAQFSELLNQVEALNTDGPSGPDGPSAIAKESDAQAQSRERVGPHEPGPVQFPTVPGYRIAKEGVCEVPKDDDKPEVRLTLAPCGVVAHCRDGRRENWGAYLRWADRDGITHEAPFPVGRFHESGGRGNLPGELANLGLPIVPGMERRLLRYFANCNPKTRFRAAIQTGWQEGMTVFVLPAETIGDDPTGEPIVYQPERYSPTGHSVGTRGTLSDWQTEVAARCAGNPVLVFYMAASLAAPLLSVVGQEGGGFHLFGQTSKGKTTAEQVAASVWGATGATSRRVGIPLLLRNGI